MGSEAAQASFVEAFRTFPTAPFLPKEQLEKLSAESHFLPNETLNQVASTANPGNKLPFKMLYGFPPPFLLLAFLTLGFFKVLARGIKEEEKGKLCFYLNGKSSHPHDSHKLLLPNEWVMLCASVTRWHPQAT